MDWLGAVGGIEQFLISCMIVVFGGYARFNAMMETVNYMCINQPDNIEKLQGEVVLSKTQKEREDVMNFSTWSRI